MEEKMKPMVKPVKKFKKYYKPKTKKKIEVLEKEVWREMQKKTRCLADEIIRQELAWEKRDVKKAAEIVWMNPRTAYLKTHTPSFLKYLDANTMDNSNLAKILGDKVKEHYNLPAGEDKDLPKYLDMVFKVKWLYTNKLTLDVSKEPEAITLMKRIIDWEEVFSDNDNDNNNNINDEWTD